MKIRPLGAKLFHADRRRGAGTMRAITAFHNFPNEPKNGLTRDG